jgi:hypothetical protein
MTGVPPQGEHSVPNSIVALAHPELLLGEEFPLNKKQRATLVASVALWTLREGGAIDFSAWHYKRLWVRRSALMVGIRSGQSNAGRFEQDLLNQARIIASHRVDKPDNRVKVRDVIYEWLEGDYENPFEALRRKVAEGAETAGWYEVVLIPRGIPIMRLFGPRKFSVPSPARAAALRSAAVALSSDWQRFLRDENELSRWLIATVERAIRDRTLQNDA